MVLFHRRSGGGRRGAGREGSRDALGVGLLYDQALPGWLQDHLDLVDYVEVVPDMFWTDRGPGARPRFVELPAWMKILDWLAVRRPLVVHAHGLSLGSAGVDDPEYRDHLAAWSQRHSACWLSDRLSFDQVRGPGGRVRRAALPLPLAHDEESLALVAGRVRAAQERLAVPFLVENSATYLDLVETEMTEAGFLNALAARTGCGLLLDIHNLYLNTRRRGQDPRALLEELDLGAVMEIHVPVAGPAPVWELLARTAPRAPALRGVTLEFHESSYAALGPAALCAELEHAHDLWPWAREN